MLTSRIESNARGGTWINSTFLLKENLKIYFILIKQHSRSPTMEIQVPLHFVSLYYPNGQLKEQIDDDETGRKHGAHLYYLENGLLDIVHFYECGEFVCAL